MQPSYVPLVGVLELLTLVIATPVTSVFIAYAAWHGRPKGLNRPSYFIAFVVIGAISVGLMVLAQRMHADVRTAQYLLRVVCFFVGAFLLGVSWGCGLGALTYRPPEKT